jgi:hypothetical protein
MKVPLLSHRWPSRLKHLSSAEEKEEPGSIMAPQKGLTESEQTRTKWQKIGDRGETILKLFFNPVSEALSKTFIVLTHPYHRNVHFMKKGMSPARRSRPTRESSSCVVHVHPRTSSVASFKISRHCQL